MHTLSTSSLIYRTLTLNSPNKWTKTVVAAAFSIKMHAELLFWLTDLFSYILRFLRNTTSVKHNPQEILIDCTCNTPVTFTLIKHLLDMTTASNQGCHLACSSWSSWLVQGTGYKICSFWLLIQVQLRLLTVKSLRAVIYRRI